MIRVNSDEETGASLSMADLTPLIDVVFIVLVFLMLTANVQTLSLPVDLPQASAQEASATNEPKTITVSILHEGEPWALEEERFNDWETFSNVLLNKVKSEPNTTVLIAGDKEAPLGNLVKLMMFLSQHQIEAAQILMEETAS
ncbi:hypothetical protein ACH42_00940 [Endozoicomonas sp. (ex Bugula neritina AB1)]|nr:hypothetical protein ACH42_00940 [Endozoicomonas sp. (ex Bugula neritina AB1)]